MATKFNARHGVSVGITPTSVIDSNGSITANTLTVTTITSNVVTTGNIAFGNYGGSSAVDANAGVLAFGGDGAGFTSQYGDALHIRNEQGSTEQTIFLGDTDAANTADLFGVSINTTKILGLTGQGLLSVNAIAANNLTVAGNLTVSGTTTYINTTNLNVGDNIITLNADLGAVAPSENAGFEINRGTSANVAILWDETNDRWTANGGGFRAGTTATTFEVDGVADLVRIGGTIVGGGNGSSRLNIQDRSAGYIDFTYSSTVIGRLTNSSNNLLFTVASNNTLLMAANGNVGIGGNSTPNDTRVVIGAGSAATSKSHTTTYWYNEGLSVHQANNTANNAAFVDFRSAGGNAGAALYALFDNHTNGNTSAQLVFGTTYNGFAPTERARFVANGYFGLGTTAPTKVLDVYRSSTTTVDMILRNDTVGLASYVNASAGVIGTTTAHPLTFTANNAEVVRVAANGNVGIGTSTPTYTLDIGAVAADARMRILGLGGNMQVIQSTNALSRSTTLYTSNGGVFEIGSRGSGAALANSFYIYDNNGGAYRMAIVVGGNTMFGAINTTSVALATVDVKGTLRTGNTTFVANNGNTITSYMLDSDTLSFEGNSGQLFSISDDLSGSLFSVNDISGIPSIEAFANGLVNIATFGGNVFIGTSTSAITVNGAVAFANAVTGSSTISVGANVIANTTAVFVGNSTVNTIITQTTAAFNANSTTTALFVAANGNVGIGNTLPGAKLSVNGLIRGENGANFGGSGVFSVDAPYVSNGRLIVTSDPTGNGTNGSPNANVGIGNTNPQHKLSINGSTYVGSSLNVATTFAAGNTTIAGFANVNGNVTVNGSFNIIGSTSDFILRNTTGIGGADEGGELKLWLSGNTTLNAIANTVSIDIFQNKLRIFETGSPNRGVYIDLSTANSGVGTNLLTGGGGGGGGFTNGQSISVADLIVTGNTTVNTTFTVANSSATSFIAVANGNIGIGNTTPDRRLRVDGTVGIVGNTVITSNTGAANGTVGSRGMLEVVSTGDYTGNTLVMSTRAAASYSLYYQPNSPAGSVVTWGLGQFNSGTDYPSTLYFDRGNVAIGVNNYTTTLNSSYKLLVNGATWIRQNNTGASAAALYIGAFSDDATTPAWVVSTDDATGDNMVIHSNRYNHYTQWKRNSSTGIKYVAELAGVTGNKSTFSLSHADDTGGDNTVKVMLSTGSDSWINSTANVGIGTSAPNAKLQVAGTANVSGNVVMGGTLYVTANAEFGGTVLVSNKSTGNTGNTYLIIEADNDNNVETDTPHLMFRKDGGADSGAIYFNDNELTYATYGSGGLTKSHTFRVADSATAYGTAANTSIPLMMSIQSNGVAVGTSTLVSGAKLTVSGNAAIDQSLTVTSAVSVGNSTTNTYISDSQVTTTTLFANTASVDKVVLFGPIQLGESTGTSGQILTSTGTGVAWTSNVGVADLTVSGNLIVSGTTTYINTTNLNVGDNIITLNADLGAVAPTENAGIEINRGSAANVNFIWDESTDVWASQINSTTKLSVSNSIVSVVGNTYMFLGAFNGEGGELVFANSTGGGGPIIDVDGGNAFRVNTYDNSAPIRFNTGTTPTTKLQISANGNIGVGNTTPTHALRVEGNTSINGTTFATTFDVGTNMFFGTSSSNPVLNFDSNDYLTYNKTSNQLTFFIGASAQLTQNSTIMYVGGKLGVGNTTPTENFRVEGTMAVNAGSAMAAVFQGKTTTYNINANTATDGSTVASFVGSPYSGSTNTAIAVTSMHGTGYAAVQNRLFVQSDVGGTYSTGLSFRYANSTNGSVYDYPYIASSQGGTTTLYANNETRLVVGASGWVAVSNGSVNNAFFAANGNVGIGTTAPDTKLRVDGALKVLSVGTFAAQYADIRLLHDGTPTANGYRWALDGNAPQNLYLQYTSDGFSATATARMYVSGANGNIGISNTAPSNKLVVNGTAYFVSNTGIGTATASRMLHVNSGIYAVANFDSAITPAPANLDAGEIIAIRATTANAAVTFGGSDARVLTFGVDTGSRAYMRGIDLNMVATSGVYLSPGGGSPVHAFVANGNVGIGTSTPGYKLEVNGAFAATTKSFVIPHPTKEGMRLRYGSLEGPENGVYVRGRTTTDTIELPDYWVALVDEDSITVELTPIGKYQKLFVKEIKDNKVIIANDVMFSKAINCFYTVYGERKDVDKLKVES